MPPDVKEALTSVDQYINSRPHAHCSWDVPGGCDGQCDCGLDDIKEAWGMLKRTLMKTRWVQNETRHM
jgi:hypothetical protein